MVPKKPDPDEKPPPLITPYEQELKAMEVSAVAFDQLNDDQRRRVLDWLGQRYRLVNCWR